MSQKKTDNSSYKGGSLFANEGPLSGVFNGFFMLIAAVLCNMVLVLFIVSLMNVIKYHLLKRRIEGELKYNQIILRNTLDYRLLSYIDGNDKEPLYIKTYITITNAILKTCGIYVLMLCIEAAIIIVLIIIVAIMSLIMKSGDSASTMAGISNLLNIKVNVASIAIVGMSFMGTISAHHNNKTVYTEDVLPKLLETRRMLYNLKQAINPNLYIDNDYLEALRYDDIDRIKSLVTKKIASGDIDTTAKMLFTYDVYTHYQEIFTISDNIREEIKNKFKPEVLKRADPKNTFEPAEYLIYTDDSIQLLTFENRFINIIVRDDAKLQSAFGNNLDAVKTKEDIYLKNVNNISKNINKTILENNTTSLVDYIYSAMYRAFIALALIVFTLYMLYIYYFKGQNGPNIGEKIGGITNKMG